MQTCSHGEPLGGRRPQFASEPARVEHAASHPDHGADDKSVKAVDQQIS
jgi:hypothetical protein